MLLVCDCVGREEMNDLQKGVKQRANEENIVVPHDIDAYVDVVLLDDPIEFFLWDTSHHELHKIGAHEGCKALFQWIFRKKKKAISRLVVLGLG